MRTFKLSDYQKEEIHRIFGGEEIIESEVQTVNTGGWVMNDLYPTKNGHLVVVFEYGAYFLRSKEQYYNDEYHVIDITDTHDTQINDGLYKAPMFHWDEPLEDAND